MLSKLISFIINFAIGMIGIGLVVFLHELGHFIAARIFKVDVETLSFGMGPVVFKKRIKQTDYCISLLPFGGYCRMKGTDELKKALSDEQAAFKHTEKGSLFAISPIIRFLIYLAGPVANLVLAIFLFTLVYGFSTEYTSNPAYVLKISDYPTLYEASINQEEIQTGDLVLKVNGQEVEDYDDFTTLLKEREESAELTVLRDGAQKEVTINRINNAFGLALYQKPIIGRCTKDSKLKENDLILEVNGIKINNTNDFYVLAKESETLALKISRNNRIHNITILSGTAFPFAWLTGYKTVKGLPLNQAFVQGLKKSLSISFTTLDGIRNIFNSDPEKTRNTITGPTRAAQQIGQITMLGAERSIFISLRALIYLLAIVSISLFIANMLPIPNFDGGQMLFNLFAFIRRRDVTPKEYVVLQILGLVCTGLILLFMYGLDFIHYFVSPK